MSVSGRTILANIMQDQRQLPLTNWKIYRNFLHNFALNALNLKTKIQRIRRKFM